MTRGTQQTLSGTVEGIICNDDFTDRVTDVPFLIRKLRPAFVLVQEGKETRYAKVVERAYNVRQRGGAGPSGVAVITDSKQCRWLGAADDRPAKVGGGWQYLAQSEDTLPRGVVWQDVAFGVYGCRLASAHRFPWRDKESWPAFDRALREWWLKSPLPVVLGLDANEVGGPTALRAILPPTDWMGHHVDGVLTTKKVDVTRMRTLPYRWSDHQALSFVMKVGRL